MDPAFLAGTAARRSAIYWTLAELFLRCPDQPFVDRLGGVLRPESTSNAVDSMREDLAGLAALLPETSAGVEEVAIEYTRLFGGLSSSYGPPPPYESLHRGSASPGEAAASVSRAYADAQLSPADVAVPPDHLGIELKFLALLCHEESEAWRTATHEQGVAWLQRERAFMDEHLMAWLAPYLALLEPNAQLPFYRKVMSLTLRYAQADERYVDRALKRGAALIQ
jgi:TorA maturation chaperone TorD